MSAPLVNSGRAGTSARRDHYQPGPLPVGTTISRDLCQPGPLSAGTTISRYLYQPGPLPVGTTIRDLCQPDHYQPGPLPAGTTIRDLYQSGPLSGTSASRASISSGPAVQRLSGGVRCGRAPIYLPRWAVYHVITIRDRHQWQSSAPRKRTAHQFGTLRAP